MCALHDKSEESSFEEDFLEDDLSQSISSESVAAQSSKVDANVFVILSTEEIVKDLLETVNEVQGFTQVRIIVIVILGMKF